MKNKIIYTTFLLTTISCSSFRPYVLTNALLDPQTTTEVNYDDLNFSYALFNQFASGLTFSFKLDYSTYHAINVSNSIRSNFNGTVNYFNEWDTVTATYAEAINVSSVWRGRLNSVMFDRAFDRSTKKALITNSIDFIKWAAADTINFTISISSSISYKVNVGSIFMAFQSFVGPTVDANAIYISFYNDNDLLQFYFLNDDRLNQFRNYEFGLAEILTNVNRFDFSFQWVDTPPFEQATVSSISLYEFNLFTQQSEISIPEDPSGDTFGFEFVAVEWWNILGHLQNFTWWIVNKSPIAPVFEWIDEYVVTWISGLITFVTGVFNL